MTDINEVAASGSSTPGSREESETIEDVGGAHRAGHLNMQEILDENIGALLELMTELKADITDEWRRVKEEQAGEKELTRKIKVELPALVQLTMQQESKLHDHTSKRAGRAGEYALDLGSARVVIGERLARLRDARAAD